MVAQGMRLEVTWMVMILSVVYVALELKARAHQAMTPAESLDLAMPLPISRYIIQGHRYSSAFLGQSHD
jgi:hypothetical protein